MDMLQISVEALTLHHARNIIEGLWQPLQLLCDSLAVGAKK